ncbi:MAG: helix-turn-helix domain-containing protein [Candidatus Adiutrix sp.]
MKMQTTGGLAEITFSVKVPVNEAIQTFEALSGLLNNGGLKVRPVNEAGEELYSVEEVFPEMNPGMLIRGFRGKTDMTQVELAERLGVTQGRVSDLESGRRSVSVEMAKKLSGVFDITYQAFL